MAHGLAALAIVSASLFGFQTELRGMMLTHALVPPAEAPGGVTHETERVEESEVAPITPLAVEYRHPTRLEGIASDHIDGETLWLARCIYSETKKPEEQELVAWVVRNRVETEYRGADTYREVVLDPYQFSAFNPENRKRRFYMQLTPGDQHRGWQRALAIAHMVRHVDHSYRPFPETTRHFYSQISMPNEGHPNWSAGQNTIRPDREYHIPPRRFRFFADVR